ncbi:MAG: hypothetical protein EZS28_039322 [Streblomastix strix]|uniref:Uncharacterized protein n=1 Tax=Streblomastix strix TaxID=222440 RepID=A0A5J4U592_9EUKA|nr:MAG: hypothetical protein EZS28_039322 [Streblomastix strix]
MFQKIGIVTKDGTRDGVYIRLPVLRFEVVQFECKFARLEVGTTILLQLEVVYRNELWSFQDAFQALQNYL